MTRKLFAIAALSFRAALNEKLIQLAAGFAGLMLVMLLALSELAPGASTKLVLDMGLGTIQLLLTLIGVAVASNDLPRELERRTLYVVLSKPVTRATVLTGKYLGLVGALGALGAALLAVFYVQLAFAHITLSPWFAVTALFGWLEAAVLVAFALLLSLVTSPTLAALYTLVIFFMGHQTGVIRTFGQGTDPSIRFWTEALYRLIPNLEALNFKNDVVYAVLPSVSTLAYGALYGLCLAVAGVAAAILVLRTKEL